MNLTPLYRRYAGPAVLTAVLLAMLYLVMLLYMAHEWLLAGTLLVIVALALWTYTSAKTLALRYLFPGIAAAAVFVVFPMVYTVAIGFTNYSSQNLLDFERARQYLLDETYQDEAARAYTLELFQDAHQFRLKLTDAEKASDSFISPPLALNHTARISVQMVEAAQAPAVLDEAMGFKDVLAHQNALRALDVKLPSGETLRMASLREFAPVKNLYTTRPDGTLTNNKSGAVFHPNFKTGFYEIDTGVQAQPGFKVNVGFAHYKRIFTDAKFSEPFLRIFGWTVGFASLTVVFAAALGMLLAVLLNWDSLRYQKVYQFLLFLPYAVPGFISILIFKGLFNQNLGEINMILGGLFGIKPAWFSDPFLAKAMILLVNTWLGFPYMMVVCMGLIKSIPADLYEASAVAGAGPLTNFFEITLPLILKPLTPLLISSFAFNFNNFVLITLLTGGRPDFLDIAVPAGTTDILVSYTFRIAFQDSGQQFALASAISTVIFFIVAGITLLQMRFTRIAQDHNR
jgi:maltose/maltodextrin transport system permease protein